MRLSEVIVLAGIVVILCGPVISLAPVFTPPPGGCPCPNGLDVMTPFVYAGLVVSIIGVMITPVGLVVHYRWRERVSTNVTKSQNSLSMTIAAVCGLALFLTSGILSSIDISGPGYQVYLYGPEGFYLGTIGVGTLLFAGFSLATRKLVIAACLAIGVVLCGISLFFLSAQYGDFFLRCATDVGCNATLARTTVSNFLYYGFVLAFGSFLFGFGLSYLLSHRKKARDDGHVEDAKET